MRFGINSNHRFSWCIVSCWWPPEPDEELKGTLAPAIRDFQTAWREKSERIFPDLALSEQYGLATALTRYLLEGIAFQCAVYAGAIFKF